jgi:hypothetical protein
MHVLFMSIDHLLNRTDFEFIILIWKRHSALLIQAFYAFDKLIILSYLNVQTCSF